MSTTNWNPDWNPEKCFLNIDQYFLDFDSSAFAMDTWMAMKPAFEEPILDSLFPHTSSVFPSGLSSLARSFEKKISNTCNSVFPPHWFARGKR
jgi:hypothetical protein